MATTRQPTGAARRFRVALWLASAAVAASVFLPWCTVSGYTYTFLGVDDWKVLPIGELVVVGAGAGAAMLWLSHVKRIGLLVGGAMLVLDGAGLFVAARLADVHNADTYCRIWAAITVRPAWAGWMGLAAGTCVVAGAASNWPATQSVSGPEADVPGGSRPPGPEDLPKAQELPDLSDVPVLLTRPPVAVPVVARRAPSNGAAPEGCLGEDLVVGRTGPDARLPHLDEVLAPPRHAERR